MSICSCTASIRAPLLVDSNFFHAARPVFSNNRRHHASPSLGRYAPTPKINIDSLSETLEDHRFTNRTLVRRVRVRSDPQLAPPSHDLAPASNGSGLRQKFIIDTHRESQKLQKLTKDLAKLNDRQIKQFYPTAFKSSQQPTDTPQFSVEINSAEQQSVQCNWLQYVEEQQSNDGHSRLSDEIEAFGRYMSEIPQETDTARRVISEVENILGQAGDPSQRLILVGSRYTGMAIRHSNIDLMIPIEDPDGLPSSVRGPSATRPKITTIQMDRLTQAARLLRATGTFFGVTVEKTHVPVVSALHTATGRRVQIHCGVKPHSSLEYVLNYKTEFPTLRPLYIAMRMILETRNMLGADQQTVDTYGLTMMIVAALKLGEGKFDRLDLGRQFLHVLRFYEEAKLRRHGISVDPPGLFRKRAHAQGPKTDQPPHVRGQLSIGKKSLTRGNDLLCLQDPADFMHDLGIASLSSLRLQQVLGAVHTDVLRGLRAWDGEAEGGNEIVPAAAVADSERPSLLRFALGSNYDRIETLRDKAIFEAA